MGLKSYLAKKVEEMEATGVPIDGGGSGGSVVVKTYKDASAYQRDISTMTSLGYSPAGQSGSDRKVAIGKTAGKVALTGGIGLLLGGRSKKGGSLTVTWIR